VTRRQLARRVEWWRSRLVPEWRVCLMTEPPPDHPMDNVAGVMECDWTIAQIRVHIPDSTLQLDDRAIDRVIVHELLHAPLDQVLDHDEILEAHVAPSLWEAYREGRRSDMEQYNDRVARLIVDAVYGEPTFCTREQTQ
jgi:hypothetical protein